MTQWAWYLTRSTGIVATVLLLASLAWGLLFSARETGKRLRPAWWLDLHNGLGGLALIFTVAHLVFAFADSDYGITLARLLVPGNGSAAYTWGVLAFYGIAVAVLTSWPKKRFRGRTWRLLHILSVPATVFACLHAYQLGSDASTAAFRIVLVVSAAAVVYPLGLRVSGLVLARIRPDHDRV
jgi:DMSO/TMAO reductase YedYZ heme-binding membrane subunit